MPFRIEESFRIAAPVDRVWAYLTDPHRVVTCVPGAELTAAESESVYLGKIKVKVGPIVAAYSGKVTFTERDATAHVVRMVGEGRESTGSGSARMTMTSTLSALPDGGTEVRLVADLDVVGKLAQFGRGMIDNVNKQMLRQFLDCARALLESEPPASTAEPSTAETSAAPASVAEAPQAHTRAPETVPTPPPARPVKLLPVMLRAFGASLLGMLKWMWRLVTFEGRRGGA